MWDLRTKNAIISIKNHKKRVNCITTTDGRLLVSGGEDSMINLFDMKMMKSLFQYELEAPVLSLDCKGNYLAAGGMDRLARVYEIDSNDLLGCTKN